MKNYSVYEISGLNYEQLLNKLIKYNINAKNIHRTEKNTLILTIENKNIKKLIAVSSGKCYNISRIKTYGAQSIVNYLKLHIGGFIAFAICFLLMIINSNFITSVNIEGLQRLNKAQIQQLLTQNNIGFFTSKNSINTKNLEAQLLTTFDNLSVASVCIKGTTLQVNLKEKIYVDILDGESYNIMAPVDAKIVSISVTQGTAMYKPGDSVNAGDIIVAGYKITTSGEKVSVKAVADIQLDYYISGKMEISDTKTQLNLTGASKTFISYYFNNSLLFNSNVKSPYEFYECKIERVKMFNLLPFYMQKCTFYECLPMQVDFDFHTEQETLKKQLQYETYQKIQEDDKIINESFYITKQQDYNIIVFTLTLRKTIN